MLIAILQKSKNLSNWETNTATYNSNIKFKKHMKRGRVSVDEPSRKA